MASIASCEHILLALQLQETLLVVTGDDAASGNAFQVLQALSAAEPAWEGMNSQHQDFGREVRAR